MTTPQQPTVNPDDPWGAIKDDKSKRGPDPRTVNQFHDRDDVDSGPHAHHHTIGMARNQASPGTHVHDGVSSRKLGHEAGHAISGAKGGNAALASVIALLKNFVDFDDNTTA